MAEILREWRQAAGLTQKQIGELAYLRKSDVTKVETGVRMLNYFELRRWLAVLGLDIPIFDAEFQHRIQGPLHPLVHDPRA
ncbi:helix-turn-helix domain-containing protein [Variovorax sp. GT1P44]|uniref:helix-turn-helix domain-containing protein n=1 Tax=Variovorax sp. GT1P44 TaxID=3443742 RepID=UPI003F484FBE